MKRGVNDKITIEVAISECVVEKHAIPLREGGGSADNVNDGDVLAVRTRNSIESRQLPYAEGGDHSRHAIDARISVSRVAWQDEQVAHWR